MTAASPDPVGVERVAKALAEFLGCFDTVMNVKAESRGAAQALAADLPGGEQ